MLYPGDWDDGTSIIFDFGIASWDTGETPVLAVPFLTASTELQVATNAGLPILADAGANRSAIGSKDNQALAIKITTRTPYHGQRWERPYSR